MNTVSEPEFIQQQRAFAAHIRDPDHSPCPTGIEDRRMAIYRELFYNNIEDFISNAFPVLHAISSKPIWHQRVRAFYREHHCHSPYFAKIPDEFLQWLQQQRGEHPDDPVFIQELAHYEWAELALSVSDADQSLPRIDHNGDILRGIPVVSPVAWHFSYQYPVHLISADFQPQQAGEAPTYLVIYRDRQDQIHFLEINPVTYRLLELLTQNQTLSGQQALQIIAEELRHPDPDTVIDHGAVLLQDLRQRNIIMGSLAGAAPEI